MSKIICCSFLCQLLLGLLTSVCGQNVPPKIVKWTTSKEQFVPPGTALFSCMANGTGTLDFTWFKDGKPIVTSDGRKYAHSSRQDGSTKIEELRVILEASQLKPEDEGFYQCRVKNSYGTTLSDVTWLKRYYLEIGKVNADTVEATKGAYFTLNCKEKINSSASAAVEWVKMSVLDGDTSSTPVVLDERVQVDENVGTLCFSYVLDSDKTGVDEVYACVLKNSMDSITSVVGSKYKLNVAAENSGIVPTSLTQLFAYVKPRIALIESRVTLGCFFGGSERIVVSFTDSAGHNLATGGGGVDVRSKSSIVIKNLKKSHEGEYTCTGTGGAMKRSEKLLVLVQEKPTFLESLRDTTAVHGGSATFKCSAKAEPEAKIEWFQNGEPISAENLPNKMYLSPDQKTLKIDNLCKENCKGNSDLMVIQCNASNPHGYAFANAYLNVLYKTEIIKMSENVEYDPEKPVTFRCEAKHDPDTQLTYRWLFEDKPYTHGSVNTTSGTLYLDLPKMADKGQSIIGKWTCNATNSYTFAVASVSLMPKYVPAYIWPYWWVVLLVLVLFLLFLVIVCIVCYCLYQNRGDQYPVDEFEQKNGNNPVKELEKAGFHDYQRDPLLPRTDSATGTLSSQERTITRQKRSQGSLSGTLGRGSKENLNN